MKNLAVAAAIGFAAASVQFPAYADAKRGMEEAKEHGCLKCHEVDKKKVGPAYKDVSAKFKGKKVEEVMADMKSKPVHKSALKNVSDGSLKDIMEWVLSL